MNLRSNVLKQELSEIIKSLPSRKLTYSAFFWSAPVAILASFLTSTQNDLVQKNFLIWIFILLSSHLSMLPFIIYGQQSRAVNIQFPLLILMGITRGFTIVLLEPIFKADIFASTYLVIFDSLVVITYCFSTFAIIRFFQVTVRSEVKSILEKSLLKKRDLNITNYADSHRGLIEKILQIQKRISLSIDSPIASQSLREHAKEIDALIRDEIRPLSYSQWGKGGSDNVQRGFFSVMRSAIEYRQAPILGISFFAIPIYLQQRLLNSDLSDLAYSLMVFYSLVGLTWWLTYRSAKIESKSKAFQNLLFFYSLIFLITPVSIIFLSLLPGIETQMQTVIRQEVFFSLILIILSVLAILALELIREGRSAIGAIASNLTDELLINPSVSAQSIDEGRVYAQYLHAEVQSQLLGCKLLLLKSAEGDIPQLAPERLNLINRKLQELAKPYLPNPVKATSIRISEFLNSWSGVLKFDCQIPAEIDQSGNSGIYAAQIIEESVVNAVRHGLATEIQITVSLSQESIKIRTSNNGSLANSHSNNGLGNLLFDAFTSDWGIEMKNGRVESFFNISR